MRSLCAIWQHIYDATSGFDMPEFAQESLIGICSVPFAGPAFLPGGCTLTPDLL